MTDLSTKCDCVAVDDQDQSAHQMICALWDNDLFAKGIADWNPGMGELILVHPVESLHTSSEDSIGGVLGDVPEDTPPEEPDALQLAWNDFEDRCEEIEQDLWEAFDKDLAGWPLFNYTIDGISRVFDPEYGEWNNKSLKCHCEPTEEKTCLRCGVYRESGKGTYWQMQWRPQTIRVTDILCRCPEKTASQWNCTKCGVKRCPVGQKACMPLAMPMMKWTEEMAKAKKTKGGATAWGSWNKGGMTTTYVTCRHKGRELEFPNGKKIYGSSCHAKAPEGYKPDFGIYLDSCWFSEQTCLGLALPWQDMGLPKLDRDLVDTALVLAQNMIEKGDVLEVGCIGGHGRTGTFLALVAMRNGVETPEEAITYVREHYCEKAIESDVQEWYIKAWHAEDNNLPVPEKPKPKPLSSKGHEYLDVYQKNGKITVEKRCDGQLLWYCPECQADQDDDADECYWCTAKFTNPGCRPIEEWYETSDPSKLAEIEARVLKPLPSKTKKRTPPKAVKAVKDDPELPFSQKILEGDYGGWL